jgi:hypothetical protein
MVGMILFAAISIGLPRKPEVAVQPAVIEGAINLSLGSEEKVEEYPAKAA